MSTIRKLLALLGILLLTFGEVLMIKYTLQLADKDIFLPCDNHPNDVLSNWVDMSALKTDFDADGGLMVEGPVKFITHFPADRHVLMEAKVYKKTRGAWTATLLNMRRSDFCRALFMPTEIWYEYTKDIPKAKQRCPLPYGFTQDMSVSGTIDVSLPDKKSEGEYLIKVTTFYGKGPGELICFQVPVNLFRK